MGDITLTWEGEDYILSDRKAFEVLDEVEEAMRIDEIVAGMQAPMSVNFTKLSRAYQVMLEAAGCRAGVREIRRALLGNLTGGENFTEEDSDAERARKSVARLQMTVTALGQLLMVVMDGAEIEEAAEGSSVGKEKAPAS